MCQTAEEGNRLCISFPSFCFLARVCQGPNSALFVTSFIVGELLLAHRYFYNDSPWSFISRGNLRRQESVLDFPIRIHHLNFPNISPVENLTFCLDVLQWKYKAGPELQTLFQLSLRNAKDFFFFFFLILNKAVFICWLNFMPWTSVACLQMYILSLLHQKRPTWSCITVCSETIFQRWQLILSVKKNADPNGMKLDLSRRWIG